MSINVKLPEYCNSAGQVFSLRVVNATMHPHEDCWEYLVIAKNETWGRQEFRVLMQKSAFGSEEQAEQAVLEEPLAEIRERLDAPGEKPIDLFESDTAQSWKVL